MDLGGKLEVGSDLFNILITGGFILFIVVLFYLIFSIYKANKLKYELKRVKNLTVFEISISRQVTPKTGEPPKDWRETVGAADQFFASLANLYEGGLEKKLYDLQSQVSLEIIASAGNVQFFSVGPQEIEVLLEKRRERLRRFIQKPLEELSLLGAFILIFL